MRFATTNTRERTISVRVLGLVEEEGENLDTKFTKFVEDNLQEEISADEIEIIHRIGARKSSGGERGSRRDLSLLNSCRTKAK